MSKAELLKLQATMADLAAKINGGTENATAPSFVKQAQAQSNGNPFAKAKGERKERTGPAPSITVRLGDAYGHPAYWTAKQVGDGDPFKAQCITVPRFEAIVRHIGRDAVLAILGAKQ